MPRFHCMLRLSSTYSLAEVVDCTLYLVLSGVTSVDCKTWRIITALFLKLSCFCLFSALVFCCLQSETKFFEVPATKSELSRAVPCSLNEALLTINCVLRSANITLVSMIQSLFWINCELFNHHAASQSSSIIHNEFYIPQLWMVGSCLENKQKVI